MKKTDSKSHTGALPKKDKRNRLGRGLEALLGPVEPATSEFCLIDIEKISPDKSQPRKHFDRDKLSELAQSIKTHGLLQPVLLQKKGETYQLIAGERRWRAAGLAGLHKIPAVLKSPSAQKKALWALIENLQREDLSSIEQARAFKALLDEGKSQEDLAEALSRSRSSVTNVIRLLQLDKEVQKWVEQGMISFAQARELLRFKSAKQQREAAKACYQQSLTVQDLSRRIERKKPSAGSSPKAVPFWAKQAISDLEKSLSQRVQLDYKKAKGRLTLSFQSDKELKSLLHRLLEK